LRVCRFMSQKEFERFIRGDVLINRTDWKSEGRKTTAKGFCFFPAGPDDPEPEDRIAYLTGVVCMDVCAVFDTNVNDLNSSLGRYSDPDVPLSSITEILSGRLGGIQWVQEYSCETYSNKKFRLVKAGAPDVWRNSISWHAWAMHQDGWHTGTGGWKNICT
jgi:hypothetical protein